MLIRHRIRLIGPAARVQELQDSVCGETNSAAMPPCAQTMRWEREIEERNRPLSDEELDAMLPSTGYKILEPPAG